MQRLFIYPLETSALIPLNSNDGNQHRANLKMTIVKETLSEIPVQAKYACLYKPALTVDKYPHEMPNMDKLHARRIVSNELLLIKLDRSEYSLAVITPSLSASKYLILILVYVSLLSLIVSAILIASLS